MNKLYSKLSLIALIFIIPVISFSQVSQSWLHRYTGPEASADAPVDFCTDKKGNSYLTGKSIIGGGYYKMITVKFNSAGTRKWISKYSGPPNQNAEGTSVQVDSLGNVYASGSVRIASGQFDFIIAKYDSSGNQLWGIQYNSPFNSDDISVSSALDASGNFYVGGYSTGTGTSVDFLLLKYNSSGTYQWAQRWNGVSNSDDYLKKIILTSAGNIAVSGYSYNNTSANDFVTLMYDPSGNLLWTKIYNGPANSNDIVSDLAIDNSDNVYVCGKSTGTGTGNDYATVKYNSSGDQQWVSRYNGNASSDDSPTTIDVNSSGEVFVSGQSNAQTTYYDYLTLKLNSSGGLQWAKYYNGVEAFFDKAVDVASDASGNCFVTGNSIRFSDGTSDIVTIKYNSAGNIVWNKSYNGPGNLDDIPIKMQINYSGNIIIISDSYSYFFDPLCGTSDYLVLNYQQSGIENWESRFDGAGAGADISTAMVLDTAGFSYVTGYSFDNVANYDFATVKYNSSGAPLWAARYDGNLGIDKASGVTYDNAGYVYVTGSSQGSGSGYDIVTIKYNSDGTENWVARYNGSSNGDDYSTGILIDASGNLYVGGYRDSTGYGKGYILIKYNNSGTRQWIARYNGPGNSDDIMTFLSWDNAGNIVVTGKSIGTGTMEDIATLKFNTSGTQLWISRYNGATNNTDESSSLAVDNSGNVYVTGRSNSAASEANAQTSNYDMIIVKYNSSGAQQWVSLYNGTANSDDESNSITIDNSGNIYIAGSSNNSGSNSDYTVIKYLPNGTRSWVYNVNGSSGLDDKAFSISSDLNGNIFAAGYTNDFVSGLNYCTIKLNSSGILKWQEKYNYIDNDTDKATILKTDNKGNVFVSGFSKGLEGGIDYSTIKYIQDKSLDITALIQGFYNEALNKMIPDTARIYVRNSSSPYNLVDSSASVLDSAGNGSFYFTNVQNNVFYYIVFRHRNSIETWSSGVNKFIAGSMAYDFTSAITQAYGNNMIQKGSKFCIYNGEITGDGVIDASDMALIENDASNFKSGYLKTDLTGDDIVDGSDLSIAENNASNFIGVITP